MMRKIACLLIVFGIFGGTLMAETIKLRVSGSVTALGAPTQAFPLIANFIGSGTAGGVTGQGSYLYGAINADSSGKARLEMLDGQMVIRFDTSGDTILIALDPIRTGWLQITDPTSMSAMWQQHWTGKVMGGTGHFATAKGTFSKNAKGVLCLNNPAGAASKAVIHAWSGAITINLQ